MYGRFFFNKRVVNKTKQVEKIGGPTLFLIIILETLFFTCYLP